MGGGKQTQETMRRRFLQDLCSEYAKMEVIKFMARACGRPSAAPTAAAQASRPSAAVRNPSAVPAAAQIARPVQVLRGSATSVIPTAAQGALPSAAVRSELGTHHVQVGP